MWEVVIHDARNLFASLQLRYKGNYNPFAFNMIMWLTFYILMSFLNLHENETQMSVPRFEDTADELFTHREQSYWLPLEVSI